MKVVTSINDINAKDIKAEGMTVNYSSPAGSIDAMFVISHNGKTYEIEGTEETFTSLKALQKYMTNEIVRMQNLNSEQDLYVGKAIPSTTPTHEYKPKSNQWSAVFGSHDTNYALREDAIHGYALTIYRQSGNVQYAYHCPTLGSAIGAMNKHLNRNSRKPFTITNSVNVLKLGLPHAGRNNEGKRIGSFEIVALDKPYDDWVSDKKMNNVLIQVGLFVVVLIIAFISIKTKL